MLPGMNVTIWFILHYIRRQLQVGNTPCVFVILISHKCAHTTYIKDLLGGKPANLLAPFIVLKESAQMRTWHVLDQFLNNNKTVFTQNKDTPVSMISDSMLALQFFITAFLTAVWTVGGILQKLIKDGISIAENWRTLPHADNLLIKNCHFYHHASFSPSFFRSRCQVIDSPLNETECFFPNSKKVLWVHQEAKSL